VTEQSRPWNCDRLFTHCQKSHKDKHLSRDRESTGFEGRAVRDKYTHHRYHPKRWHTNSVWWGQLLPLSYVLFIFTNQWPKMTSPLAFAANSRWNVTFPISFPWIRLKSAEHISQLPSKQSQWSPVKRARMKRVTFGDFLSVVSDGRVIDRIWSERLRWGNVGRIFSTLSGSQQNGSQYRTQRRAPTHSRLSPFRLR
jgi:hypothetical protein